MRTAALALVSALLVLIGAGDAHAQVKRLPWLGVMADGPLTAAGDPFASEWDLVGASGVGFVRAAFHWDQLQPSGRGAAPDWSATDQVVGDAAREGLDVLPVVVGTPGWAAVRPGVGARPKRPGDYAALLRLLIARYGPRGTFWTAHPELAARPVRAWQVWNEPSLRSYWNARDWAKGYVGLLRVAHAAIKRADPGATVVMAGLPNYSWRDLARLYALGARRSFDVVALHPYTGDVKGVLTILRRNRRVMRANGDRRKPIWLTETTWPSSRGKRPAVLGWEVTDRGQAARVREALPKLERAAPALGIGRVSWYTWASQPDGARWESYAGLRTLRDGTITAKPAYAAFLQTVAKLSGR